MFKRILLKAAIASVGLTPLANAQNNEDPGQMAARGVGFAISTQERCAGHPLRSPEADRLLGERIVSSISKHTGSSLEAVRLGLAAGAMQASLAKKPTKKDCTEAVKVVAAAQKII